MINTHSREDEEAKEAVIGDSERNALARSFKAEIENRITNVSSTS